MVHGVRVARSWLEAGDTIELTLPRNLHCAGCDGGGCDRCGRAGAVSLWGREEPAAVLEVTLPRRTAAELVDEPVIVLRIPDAGGWPATDSGHPRGHLLLRLTASADPDPSVVKRSRDPSRRARPSSLTPETVQRLSFWGGLLAVVLLSIALIAYVSSRP